MSLRIFVIALCLALFSCKDLAERYRHSTTGISARDKAVFYDFRIAPVPILRALDAATQQMVLSAIPPASCPVAAIQPRPQPKIVSAVNGSFTYAAEQESAYLVSGLPCGASNRLLVFSGEKLQAASDTPYSAIIGAYDLNRDDKNELLLFGETNRDGELVREASLDSFEKNSLRPTENFGIVYHDWCALFAAADESKKKDLMSKGLAPFAEAVVISYIPHPGREMPNFTAQRYHAPCPAPTTLSSDWKLLGTK